VSALGALLTGALGARTHFGRQRKGERAVTSPTDPPQSGGGSSTDGGQPHAETPGAGLIATDPTGGQPHAEGAEETQ